MARDTQLEAVGESDQIDLAGEYLRQNFVEILSAWATRPPFFVRQGGHPQLVCCRYRDVVEVLEDSARFSTVRPSDPAAGGYIQFKPDKFAAVETLPKMDGERHGRIRRLIAPAFSAPAIQRLSDRIDRALDGLIDAIPLVAGRFDLMAAFARELMVVALLDSVLYLDDHQKAVFIRMNRALPLTAKIRPGEPFPEEYHRAFAATTETINQLIAARRESPGADLLSQLILTRDGSDLLSDKELFDLIFTFSAAALESTAAARACCRWIWPRCGPARNAFPRRWKKPCACTAPAISSSPAMPWWIRRWAACRCPGECRCMSHPRRHPTTRPNIPIPWCSTSIDPTAAYSPSAAASTSALAAVWRAWCFTTGSTSFWGDFRACASPTRTSCHAISVPQARRS